MATYGKAALTALGDPMRQAIVERLADGPLPVGELAAGLPISRPAVSQHLKVLTEAGVVAHRKLGTRRVYQLEPEAFAGLQSYLERFWTTALASFAALAEDTYPAHPPLYPPAEPAAPAIGPTPDGAPARGRRAHAVLNQAPEES